MASRVRILAAVAVVAGIGLTACGLLAHRARVQVARSSTKASSSAGPAQAQLTTGSSLNSWQVALWVAKPAEDLVDEPLRESFAQVNRIVREDPRPVPLIQALLGARLHGGARALLRHHLGSRSASETLVMIKDHALVELARAARIAPDRFREDPQIHSLEAGLLEIARLDRNLSLARSAARAYLALHPEGTIAPVVNSRRPQERFAFAGLQAL